MFRRQRWLRLLERDPAVDLKSPVTLQYPIINDGNDQSNGEAKPAQ